MRTQAHRIVDTDPKRGNVVVRVTGTRHDEATYQARQSLPNSHLRNHILPRFGEVELGEIGRMTVKAWVKSLRRSLAEPTVQDVVSLFSTIMNEAVDEGLIAANPCRRLRINTGAGSRATWAPAPCRSTGTCPNARTCST